MSALLLLLALAAPVVRPAAPTVGDPIVIELPLQGDAAIEVAPSDDYEVVSVVKNRVTIRRFKPGDFTVRGTTIAEGISSPFEVPVRVASVLGAGDRMKPSPLKPPLELPRDTTPWKWVAAMGSVALFAWIMAFLVSRRKVEAEKGSIRHVNPRAEFEAAVLAVRKSPNSDRSFAMLGDATRVYLSRVHPGLGTHLTTSEVLRRMRRAGIAAGLVETSEEILRRADLAKFSPWGAGPGNSVALADRALTLTVLAVEEKAA